MKQKRPKYLCGMLILLGISAVLNLIACSKKFCDRYTDRVYPHLADAWGKLTAPLPFALGEVFGLLGGLILLTAVISLLLLPFLRKKQGFRKYCGRLWKTVSAVLNVMLLISTLHYLIPVRCTSILDRSRRTQFSYDEVYAATEYIVNCGDAAAEAIPLNADGLADFPSGEELEARAMDALRVLEPEYPRLRGYYPPVKDSLWPDILKRMSIGGYTTEYTLETVHSKYSCSPLYQPVLDAHEMTHHKGFYRESEAEFISTLAMIRSDDPYLQLAGYLAIEEYMSIAMMTAQDAAAADLEAAGKLKPMPEGLKFRDPGFKESLREYDAALRELLPERPYFSARVNSLVMQSDGVTQELYKAEPHPIDSLPAVDETIGQIADTGWKTQAAVLQEHNYDGMALLYLQYFDGTLYGTDP